MNLHVNPACMASTTQPCVQLYSMAMTAQNNFCCMHACVQLVGIEQEYFVLEKGEGLNTGPNLGTGLQPVVSRHLARVQQRYLVHS